LIKSLGEEPAKIWEDKNTGRQKYERAKIWEGKNMGRQKYGRPKI
jgi:hypothetical protein